MESSGLRLGKAGVCLARRPVHRSDAPWTQARPSWRDACGSDGSGTCAPRAPPRSGAPCPRSLRGRALSAHQGGSEHAGPQAACARRWKPRGPQRPVLAFAASLGACWEGRQIATHTATRVAVERRTNGAARPYCLASTPSCQLCVERQRKPRVARRRALLFARLTVHSAQRLRPARAVAPPRLRVRLCAPAAAGPARPARCRSEGWSKTAHA